MKLEVHNILIQTIRISSEFKEKKLREKSGHLIDHFIHI